MNRTDWMRRNTLLLLTGVGAVMSSSALGQEAKRLRTFLVFGDDDRTLVENTAQLPWSSMGMVIAHWGQAGQFQIRTGTGTLISKHVVLTAGHVVYDSGIGWSDQIYFIPGLDAQVEPFGTFPATEAVTTDQWAATKDDDHDLAMLLLDSAAGSVAGTMRIAGQPPSFYEDRALNLSGYPSDLVWNQLYNAPGQSQRLEENRIRHFLDGAQGESGGPMWYADPGTGEAVLVGVYAGDVEVTQGGAFVEAYGYGIPMNATACSWVSDYVGNHDADANISCEAAQDNPKSAGLPACGGGIAQASPTILVTLALVGGFRVQGSRPRGK